MQIHRVLRTGLLCAAAAWAQTRVDLQSQGKNADFSQATFTKPAKTGTALPATCGVGEFFFKTDAAPGFNLYGCTSVNLWTLEAGGVSTLAGLTDLRVSLLSNVYTVAAGNVRFGNVVNVFPAAALTVSGADTGTIRFFVDYNGGTPQIGCRYPATFTGTYTPSNMVCATGSAFPDNSVPLAAADITVGVPQTPSDLRATQQSSAVTAAGNGIVSAYTGRTVTVSVDTARVPQKFFGAGAPGNVGGSTRGDLYYNTSASPADIYQCLNASTCAVAADWNKIPAVVTHTAERLIGFCDSGGAVLSNPVWAVDTGSPGAASCGSGLPASFATAYRTLTNTADSGFRTVIPLPVDWDSTKAVDLQIYWAGTATANLAVTFGVSTACLSSNANFAAAVTYNTEQTVSAAEGTAANAFHSTALSSLTMTGCSPGDLLRVKVLRRVSDPSANDALFLGAGLRYRTTGS
jgi:hypothetical protein